MSLRPKRAGLLPGTAVVHPGAPAQGIAFLPLLKDTHGLLVEDTLDELEYLRATAQHYGATIDGMPSAEQAFAWLGRNAPPAWVLLDFNLDGPGTGVAVATRVAATIIPRPVVISYSSARTSEIAQAIRASGNDPATLYDGFIAKPTMATTIMERIAELLHQRATLMQQGAR